MDKPAVVCYCTKPWNCIWNREGKCELNDCRCMDICIGCKEDR